MVRWQGSGAWARRSGMTCRRGVGWPAVGMLAALLVVVAAGDAPRAIAQGPGGPALASASPTATEHVFVSGVADTFDELRAAIDRVKRETGRDYRVLVVGAGPEGDRSAREVLDAILDRWGREAPTGTAAGAFDPSQDVLIYVDVKRKRLAMHAPWSLETGAGLDPATIERELIDKVFRPRAQDGRLDAGLVDLVAATEKWVKDREDRKRARAEADRVFRTRTLPLAAGTVAGLGLLGLLAARWSRHGRKLREAREKLAAFKTDVVALSDLIDGQRERHRMLPHSDPDFATPMQGRTRETYDGVQAALERYRERWLGLMDVWEKADGEIAAEKGFGTARAEEAIRILDAAGSRPPLEEVARECRAPLDDLEQAHESARAMADEDDAVLAAVRKRLEGLAGRGRSSASFETPLAEAARAMELARAELEADPLSARAKLEQARAVLDTSDARLEAFEADDDRRRQVAGRVDALEAAIRARRAEGWLLREPGADPTARVTDARRHLDGATQLLDAGELEAARKHVEEAERLAADGMALLESVVAAKTRVEELLPGAVARLEALAGKRDPTRRALEALAAGYASESWAEVADNAVKADEGLSRARAMVAEAREAARPERQEYFRSLALVEEAIRQEDWVERCLAAVTDRRAELDGLRASLPGKCADVGRRVGALERRLQAQRTDRVRANEQCREAGRLVQVAERALAVDRPDLPRTGQVIDAADAAAEGAERLADDDERLAGQAVEGIEAAQGALRRAASWYAEGVRPDVRGASAAFEDAKGLLSRQRYEDAIRAAAESQRLSREALAEAGNEANRRRRAAQLEAQRRQMEDSFVRMSRGSGPWVIQLPGGTFSGPDPWRTVQSQSGGRGGSGGGSGAAEGQWSSRTAEGGW